MEMLSLLEESLRSASSSRGRSQRCRLILVLSRGVVRHEPVFKRLLDCLLSYPTKEPPSADLLLSLYHPLVHYTDFLKRPLGGQASAHRLFAVDFPSKLRQFLTAGNATADEVPSFIESLLLESIDNYRRLMVDASGSQYNRTVCIDDLSVAFDAGVSLRSCQRIISSLLSASEAGPECCDALILGFHRMDSLCTDVPLQRFINRLCDRANLTFEVCPLETGYTQTLDGQLTVTRSSDSGYMLDPRTQHYHYRCEGRSIHCYPPGRSGLVS